MEKFSIRRNNRAEILVTAESLISEGEKLGIDVARLGLPQKIRSIKESVEGDISIVLLGSFSDGKTSTIAGFSGRTLANMKIDTDESSDQLEHYKIPGNAGFEFVDTPGLFGTKEKEIDGASVRYSEVTKRYISEAHIVVYLCDAGVPLKESHVPVVRKVLRDFRKLESTVFVLNKMDEAGYDLLDEEDFREGCEIKRTALIKRLKDTIGLTAEEESRLRIVCIAAAPKGKGVEYWRADKERTEDYLRRSHIGDFRKAVQEVIDETDEEKVRASATDASLKEVFFGLRDALTHVKEPLEEVLRQCMESCEELDRKTNELNNGLKRGLDDLKNDLKEYEEELVGSIKDATILETFETVMSSRVGLSEGKVTCEKFIKKIERKVSNAAEEAHRLIEDCEREFRRQDARQKRFLKKAKDACAEQLSDMPKISHDAVRGSDFASAVNSGIEFKKPLELSGAIRAGVGISALGGVGLGVAQTGVLGATAASVAVAVSAFLPVIGVIAGLGAGILYFREKAAKKEALKKGISEVSGALEKGFNAAYELISGEEFFRKTFAPGYAELLDMLEVREGEIESLKELVAKRDVFAQKIDAEMAILGK